MTNIYFAAPRVARLDRPVSLLAGGLSRVNAGLSGWGGLLVEFHGADGRRTSLWRVFAGSDVQYSIDIRPPGVLSISVINCFGMDRASWDMQTGGEIPPAMGELKIHQVPVAIALPHKSWIAPPRSIRLDAVHLGLPQPKIPEVFMEPEK